jgi:pimeloyl-ACP methyl ester carboxylesterase
LPFIEVENGRLYYSVNGSGPPLVLLHSAWATSQWWRWQIPALSRNYRTYALDVRGHGQSTPLEKVYSVEGFSKDLTIFIRKLGLDSAVLVGWSLGGIIAMQYCLDHPSSIKALVLIATQGHRNPRLKPRFILYFLQAQLSLLMDFTHPRKYDRSTQQFPGQGNLILERQVRNMLSPKASKEALDWIIADITNNPRTTYWEVIRSVWNWEAGEKLSRIKVPTLILVGDGDSLTPPQISQRLHRAIPHSKLVIVKDASHYVVLERPEFVNTEILNFLKQINY